jgi:hypothetical protein
MPVFARLSSRFYEVVGEDVAQQLVDWLNHPRLAGSNPGWAICFSGRLRKAYALECCCGNVVNVHCVERFIPLACS